MLGKKLIQRDIFKSFLWYSKVSLLVSLYVKNIVLTAKRLLESQRSLCPQNC